MQGGNVLESEVARSAVRYLQLEGQVTPLEWFLVGALVFVSGLAYDFTNARYVRVTASPERHPIAAANWSVTTYLVGLVGLVGVLSVSKWLILPELAGLWMGTYLASRGEP